MRRGTRSSAGAPRVKVLNDRLARSAEVRARFLREGQAAARIRHPHVVDVYDVGDEGGRAYLVMELLEGEDLRSVMARECPLSTQRAADSVGTAAACAQRGKRCDDNRSRSPDQRTMNGPGVAPP